MLLFVDNRARRLGDLLTVVIQETTGIGNNDERKASKDTNAGGAFNFKGSSTAGQLSRAAQIDLAITGSATRGIDGKSQYTVDQNFQDRMTVTVMDVLPNGNLVVEGYRRRIVSGEERLMCVTGVVRPIDISIANTVQSQSIANFNISYLGKGAESAYTSPGLLGRFFNCFWPF
jgi:flagellar L-ring protein precursor FlgH